MLDTLAHWRAESFRRLRRALHQRVAERVLATPSLPPGTLPFTLLSMVQHRDVTQYLVAAKSFLRQAPARAVRIVCDPSLSVTDRAVIVGHIPGCVFVEAREFHDPRVPKGGAWERLMAISHYSPTGYIVQLDADTVTTAALPEVVSAVEANVGFVLGECEHQTLEELNVVSQRARGWISTPSSRHHIQAIAEAELADCGFDQSVRYVRGCAGFTGFPGDPDMQSKLLDFSQRMQSRIGDRWSDWGSEQFASNFLVANAVGTRVLPFPRYTDPKRIEADTAFIHYIGHLRYADRSYERWSRRLIAGMARSRESPACGALGEPLAPRRAQVRPVD